MMEFNPITNEYFQEIEKFDFSYNLIETNDPDSIYDDILWFQNQLSNQTLSKFQTIVWSISNTQNILILIAKYNSGYKLIHLNIIKIQLTANRCLILLANFSTSFPRLLASTRFWKYFCSSKRVPRLECAV